MASFNNNIVLVFNLNIKYKKFKKIYSTPVFLQIWNYYLSNSDNYKTKSESYILD